MPHMRALCLFAIAQLLAGQVRPGGPSAGARPGTVSWEAADTILIGELTGGTLVASGARLRCTGFLQAHRVLKGDAGPGSQFSLAWEFEPMLPVIARARAPLPPQYGLWMLERTAEGSLRPLRSPMTSNALGGHYLPLPPTQPAGSLAYTKESPLDFKLAAELAAAMESIAVTAGDNLNVKSNVPPSEGGGRMTESASRFKPLLSLLLSPIIPPRRQSTSTCRILRTPTCAQPESWGGYGEAMRRPRWLWSAMPRAWPTPSPCSICPRL